MPEIMRVMRPGHRAGYAAGPRPRPMRAGVRLAGRRRDGSTFPAEISLSAIDAGEGILITAAIRDATERLAGGGRAGTAAGAEAERDRLERQLHQSQRLESLGQPVGEVAHGFNNLLGVISSYAAFVAEEARAALPGWRPGKPSGQTSSR